MIQNAWLIPVFPLIAFVILLLFGRKLKQKSAYIGMTALALSFILSLFVLSERIGGETYTKVFKWISFGDSTITMGFEVTALNAMMLIVVTVVSLLVHIFSREYMKDDDRIHVFYSYLGLFSFSMLGLVLSPNVLQLFIFWELVGLCSYLLVGFWYFKPEAAAAAKKAFLTTRVGDIGLLIGLFLLFNTTGSFEYSAVFAAIETGLANGSISQTLVTVIAICIFLGAVGKSAQFPLHVWLPDAMEGPTPVSALIHAATMVAAGVYLVGVMYPVFLASEVALTVVAVVGGITGLFAATIALVQNDIKRVLAYSTISQLGLMMLALGTIGYVAGLFHLMTHAFFKALLFLGAGSVIHALNGEQDIRYMGGLWNKMKSTSITFLVGALAIAGVPPLAGFWSKELILASAWENGGVILFLLAVLTSLLTAFYMFRLFFVTFTGEYRGQQEPKENNSFMTMPLFTLGILAIVAGFANSPLGNYALEGFLTEGLNVGTQAHGGTWLIFVSLAIAIIGIGFAYLMNGKKSINPASIAHSVPGLYKFLLNKYYIDELYHHVIVRPVVGIGKVCKVIDQYIVDGIVNLVGFATRGAGRTMARGHNGQLQTYGLVTIIGGLVVIALAFVLGGYLG